jgi:hypothetical protein
MRVITDGKVIPSGYTPPEAPKPKTAPQQGQLGEAFAQALAGAIVNGFRTAIASLPAPVVNVPRPEVRINAPVYVQPPEIKIPASTVNVPDGKAPIVNIEPASVTLQTNRPSKWKFTHNRDEFGRITTTIAEDISNK